MKASKEHYRIHTVMEWLAAAALGILGLSQLSSAMDLDSLYPGMTEYCEGDSFRAQCGVNENIIMQQAVYGRMMIGKCITKPLGEMNCQTDVRHILDRLCSGRKECDVRVAYVYESLEPYERPCSNEVRSFLAASYTCVKVITPNVESCAEPGHPPLRDVTQPSGYLSSLVTQSTQCGTFDKPWTVRLQHGLKMRITLYDFASSTRSSNDFEGGVPDMCTVYAVIKEKITSTNRPNVLSRTICGSDRRESVVYTSSGNEIEMRVSSKRNTDDAKDYFLFRYEAFGCALPPPPSQGWVKFNNGRAEFGCDGSDLTWALNCQDQAWVGKNETCVAADGSIRSGASTSDGDDPWSKWFSGPEWVAIVTIACIAVTIGLVIFMFGLFYIRRKRTLAQDTRYGAAGGSTYQRPNVNDFYSHTNPPIMPGGIPPPEYTDRSKGYIAGTIPVTVPDVGYGSQFTNDYMRTWQLQRNHNAPRQDSGNGVIQATADGQNSQIDGRPMSEHIYESPDFNRKFEGDITANTMPGSAGGNNCNTAPVNHDNFQSKTTGNLHHGNNGPTAQTKPFFELHNPVDMRPFNNNNHIMGSSGHTV